MMGLNSKLTGVGFAVPPGEEMELEVGEEPVAWDAVPATYAADVFTAWPGQPWRITPCHYVQ